MHIGDKLKNIEEVKEALKIQLDRTGQNTNVKFRSFTTLIENIPNKNTMTQSQINNLTTTIIEINGEDA